MNGGLLNMVTGNLRSIVTNIKRQITPANQRPDSLETMTLQMQCKFVCICMEHFKVTERLESESGTGVICIRPSGTSPAFRAFLWPSIPNPCRAPAAFSPATRERYWIWTALQTEYTHTQSYGADTAETSRRAGAAAGECECKPSDLIAAVLKKKEKKKKQSATFHSLACAGILAPPAPNVWDTGVSGGWRGAWMKREPSLMLR